MNIWLNLLPVTSAAIGLVISLLASRLFFSAQINRRFWEKKKARIAAMAADFLEKDDMLAMVTKNIADADNFKKILPLVEEHVDHFLRVKLKEAMPMIGMLIGDRTISQLKEIFIGELQELFPSVMHAYANQLRESINIRELIAKKIDQVPPGTLASLVQKEAGSFLLLAGALSGFVIGIIQWLILFLVI